MKQGHSLTGKFVHLSFTSPTATAARSAIYLCPDDD